MGMVSCPGDAAGGSSATLLLRVWQQWQITILLLVSATLQLLLVLAGFWRKRMLSRTFHGFLWLSFLGMEAASIYALGLMLASGCDHVFSLWAPLLLFHMGAADAINAYAPADNELWRRFAFKMALSLIATAFILSRADICQRYMPAGILLAIVGTFKYAERVYALRQGSAPQTLMSARPIYNYMACGNQSFCKHGVADQLLVAGEWQWYKEGMPHNMVQWYKEGMPRNMVVQYGDILKTPELMDIKDLEDLCLAYALFKIYRRRLSNLRIHSKEEDYRTVKKTIFHIEDVRKNLIKVIDLEMSFIFDGVFTKAAAGSLFQGIGLVTRLLSALLLLIALLVLAFVRAMEVGCTVSSNEHNLHLAGAHGPLQGLTCFFIVLAILVECLQIYRHVRCNTFRVWLAYTYITEKRCIPASTDIEGERERSIKASIEKLPHNGHFKGGFKAEKSFSTCNNGSLSRFMIMMHTLQMKAILSLLRYGSTVKTSTHWHYKIGQCSVLADTLALVFRHYFITFQVDGMRSTWRKKQGIMQLFKVDAEELQASLIKRLLKRCKELNEPSAEEVRRKVASRVREPLEDGEKAAFTGFEEVVLHWHIVTSICELDILQESKQSVHKVQMKNEHQRLSIWLSRYCLYLMLKCHKLIPEDPDMAASLYAQVKQDLCVHLLHSMANFRPPSPHEDSIDIETPLLDKVHKAATPDTLTSRDPLQVALHHSKLLLQDKVPWNRLAQVWLDIVIYIAATENATPHTEQMAKGGELLTLLWVVLGHLGIGQNV